MHVVFLSNEYPPAPHGGIGSFVQTLGRALVVAGNQVTVCGLYPAEMEGESQDQGVRVIRLARIGPPGLRILINTYRVQQKLRQLHREKPISLIEGDDDTAALFGGRVPASIPTVLRMHGGYMFFETAAGRKPVAYRTWLERRAFHRARHLAAVSRYVGVRTSDLLGLGNRPFTVIHNCVDLNLFQPEPGTGEAEGLIVFAGTLIEKKGIRQLIEAMDQVVKACPQARLAVYGGDTVDPLTGGSYRQKLEDSLTPIARPHVEFPGRVERARLPGILARASICCYPSHMEAMPIAWIEGMAMGKAVLASSLGPGPEVLTDGQDGLLVDCRQAQPIAGALIRLLQDAGLRRRLGEAARQRVAADYGLALHVQRNLGFYRAVVDGTAPGR
ncbi:MAG: glycosyltransferase family 4 protein [Acidobacteriia bacterium]|nr:glycosyltransferase family 4 protein [Terriglobia bacterium]